MKCTVTTLPKYKLDCPGNKICPKKELERLKQSTRLMILSELERYKKFSWEKFTLQTPIKPTILKKD